MKTPGQVFFSEPRDTVTNRAAVFFERRHFGRWSDGDRAEFDAWLAESDFHLAAYLRLEGVAAYTEHLNAVHGIEIGPRLLRAAFGGGRSRYRRFVFPFLAAASIALIVAFGIPFVNSLLQPADRNFSTDIGGRTLVKFADGTEIELNTDTAMRFRMTSAERTVWLEKGEAWFRVAHNAANPFSVVVGRHRITDLGTEFSIRREAEDVEVALLNGHAELNTEGTPATLLRPGDDAVATPVSVSITRKTPQELADELAWRRGMLVFRNTRLVDAVREINRYSAIKLVIADPSIADLRFNGEIKNDNLQDFLETAQSMMKIRADRQGKDILLSRDAPEQTTRPAHAKRGP